MATDRSPHETFIQSSGMGRRITSSALTAAMADSPTLRQCLLHHAFTFQVQMSFTALANARHTVGERLARWLLMSEDRLGPQINLTHEFLSLMLGVRRPGITTVLNEFEKQGVLTAKRGSIIIRDRNALLEAANGCYGAPEAEYERLFGKQNEVLRDA
jgi:CRP-like cAMP-binding protein